jgi:hypothetical protein
MEHDFNELEQVASRLISSGAPQDAIRIYFFMADGDPSLDGGYLAKKIAECYEKMGHLYAAKYWYGQAVQENPQVRLDCAEAQKRLETLVSIDDLVNRK